MWIIALLLSIVVNLIITKVIMTKITDKTEHSFMYIEDGFKQMESQLSMLKELNEEVVKHLKEHETILIAHKDEIKTNSDFADRYIEQLHTKITELEVTLQNIVNKI